MKKIHILIYGHEFPNPVEPVRGSFIERSLKYYADDIVLKIVAPVPWFLSWRRHKKNVMVPHKDNIIIGDKSIEIFRPRYILFPKNILRPLIGWLEFVTTFYLVKKLHRIWKIDLVHVNFALPDGIAIRHICKKLDVRYIITEHQGAIGCFLKVRSLKSQILKAYYEAAKTIVVSEFTKNEICKNSVNPVNCEVVPNGVQTNRFKLKQKSHNPKKLVFIGNLIFTKGIHVLINALSILRKQGHVFSLIIIGDGKYRAKLEELVVQLELQDYVSFLGLKSPDDIVELLPEYDILVQPSFIESFSIVLIEAMAAGLPVIATRCGGPEYIVSKDTGILVPPNSVRELADAIQKMSEQWINYNPDVISNYAKQNYDIILITQKICSLYRDVVNEEDTK
jgi:teichuronic acid biosynthesis glycosyltransferase TuaC